MYGNHLSISRYGITLIVNGHWMSFFENLNTGKWKFKFTQNYWRRTRTPIPKPILKGSYRNDWQR